MKRLRLGVSAALLVAAIAPTRAAQPPDRPARHVLVVSVDGLRPDLLLRADAPNARALMSRGSFTLWARTVEEGYTVPSHVSMLTGVTPARHGVTWDNHIEDAYPAVPTLFELAKRAGYTTAVAAGKTKFVVLTKPGTLDWSFIANEDLEGDLDVSRHAAALIQAHRPDVMFVHLGQVDTVGHSAGWGSPAQLAAIATADTSIGLIVQAVRDIERLDSTMIILTADHGGAGLAHPPEDSRSQLIPWIVAGPDIRRDFDLTLVPGLTVTTMSTFTTACEELGLPLPANLDGPSVPQIRVPRTQVVGVKP